jgi:glycosyltransferase involved in cell wall biosynthesis
MRVLFVSKPISLPIHDGSQCLVRDVATHLDGAVARVLGERGALSPFSETSVEVEPLYRSRGGFAPTLTANARVFAYLLSERDADLWHFVFAPNPRTSGALRWLRRVRRTPVVQTIASPPKTFDGVGRLLFGDIVVAQSAWCQKRVREHCPDRDVEMIRPSVPELVAPPAAEMTALRSRLGVGPDVHLIVYPGDLEFSGGAHAVAAAVEPVCAQLRQQGQQCVFVFACRRKTDAAVSAEAELARRLPHNLVRFVGELPSLAPLLAAASVVVFPVDSLYGKVDIPIALLETMALGTPLVCFDYGPLSELQGAVLVPTGNLDRLVREVAQLVVSPEARHSVARAQRHFVRSEMTSERAARDYQQLYRRLLPDERRG